MVLVPASHASPPTATRWPAILPLLLATLFGCAPASVSQRPADLTLVAPSLCSRIRFRLSAGRTEEPSLDLTVAVNGLVCHRERVPPWADIAGDIAPLCAVVDPFEPGWNQVEVALTRTPGCGGARMRLAVARARCAAPEPD